MRSAAISLQIELRTHAKVQEMVARRRAAARGPSDAGRGISSLKRSVPLAPYSLDLSDRLHETCPDSTGTPGMDVSTWLRDLGLEDYAQAFRANHIDAKVLARLTADDLAAI
ncbi:MAG TPA: SAM domain-containing protein, partial [Geminicoccaceae bacterium]